MKEVNPGGLIFISFGITLPGLLILVNPSWNSPFGHCSDTLQLIILSTSSSQPIISKMVYSLSPVLETLSKIFLHSVACL